MPYVWLFVTLVLVVAVVLVALGKGSSASEVVPDRRAADLPADRALDAADIDALRLPQALRGYRMSDVDEVLDRLAAALVQRDELIARLQGPDAEGS